MKLKDIEKYLSFYNFIIITDNISKVFNQFNVVDLDNIIVNFNSNEFKEIMDFSILSEYLSSKNNCIITKKQILDVLTGKEKDNLFFDGNSGSTADSLSLFQGSALLYGYISYTFKPVSWFSLSAEKLFILPVAGERFQQLREKPGAAGETGFGASVTGGQVLESIKTVLLSGLSFSISVFL